MIKIIKNAKPQILVNNAEQWTDDYLEALNKPDPVPETIKNRYKHPEIKDALEVETHGKCAYCESKILHVSYGDIEHILPKNKDARPDLIVEWSNLTLACEVCNRDNKKAYYNPDDPLINPIEDDPSNFLLALGPIICQYPGNRKGSLTIDVLDLNRAELIERRKERLQRIIPLVDSWKNEQNETLKELLHKQIQQEAQTDKEYSFTVMYYLKHVGFYK